MRDASTYRGERRDAGRELRAAQTPMIGKRKLTVSEVMPRVAKFDGKKKRLTLRRRDALAHAIAD